MGISQPQDIANAYFTGVATLDASNANAPAEMPLLQQAFMAERDALDWLAQAIFELEKRLTPLLRQRPPQDGVAKQVPANGPISSPTVVDIAEATRRIRDLGGVVQSIIMHLDC